MDQQQVVLLVLLDLSAAYDTIDIDLLLETMQKDVGLSGQTIKWYSSYMSKCTTQIKVNNILSKPFSLEYGVPHGSCNGPVLFSIYCRNLMQIVQQHLPNVHGYTDDRRLYISFSPSDERNALPTMETCVNL